MESFNFHEESNFQSDSTSFKYGHRSDEDYEPHYFKEEELDESEKGSNQTIFNDMFGPSILEVDDDIIENHSGIDACDSDDNNDDESISRSKTFSINDRINNLFEILSICKII